MVARPFTESEKAELNESGVLELGGLIKSLNLRVTSPCVHCIKGSLGCSVRQSSYRRRGTVALSPAQWDAAQEFADAAARAVTGLFNLVPKSQVGAAKAIAREYRLAAGRYQDVGVRDVRKLTF